MADALDFSELSDDQIVELAVALAREAMRRNPALEAAFRQAILDERDRVEATARGTQAARRAEVERLELQAARAAAELAQERERLRVQAALARYLRTGAELIERPVAALTLVWKRHDWGRGTGPRLQINQGMTGEDAPWHFVDYVQRDDRVYTSPGLHARQAQLLPWCREVCAAVRALGIERTIIVKGAEL